VLCSTSSDGRESRGASAPFHKAQQKLTMIGQWDTSSGPHRHATMASCTHCLSSE
jgi:hypothetical protein